MLLLDVRLNTSIEATVFLGPMDIKDQCEIQCDDGLVSLKEPMYCKYTYRTLSDIRYLVLSTWENSVSVSLFSFRVVEEAFLKTKHDIF